MAKMILIIEDEVSIQNIIRAFLENAGYTVILADNGLEGIERFRASLSGSGPASLTWCFWIVCFRKLTGLPCVRF